MTENIKIENLYLERVSSSTFQELIKKKAFDAVKPRYWLGKVLGKVVQESKHYFETKRDLIRNIHLSMKKTVKRKTKKVGSYKNGKKTIL